MKRIFTRVYGLLSVLLFPIFMFGQNRDYAILLQAGKFTPAENITTVDKNSLVFQQALFGDKYYVTLQFRDLPDATVRTNLSAAGIELMDYLPNYAYTALVPAGINIATLRSLPVRSVIQLTTEQKMEKSLFRDVVPAHAIKETGFVDVTVITYEKIDAVRMSLALNTMNARILEDMQVFRSFTIRVPRFAVKNLAEHPFVQWVECVSPAPVIENLPGRTLHRVNVLNDGPRNLKGDGVNVGIWDGGNVSPHLDFSPVGRLTLVENTTNFDHSTHCAGTIGGKGIINPIARGMAPNANIFSWNFNGNIQTEMTAGIPANSLLVSSHSYGFLYSGACSFNNPLSIYDAISRSTDIVLNTFPNHLQVHSAGNAGSDCSGGFFTITGSGKPAKNNLVVGALTTADGVTSFSSSGPVQDGRIKPEISAFGNNVFSTSSVPLNGYTTMSGTSMATPGVAGASVLLYQRYRQLNPADAPSMLIKNIICNGAHDLGNPGPDFRYGFGRINALTAVRILEDNRYILNNVTNGANVDQVITVPANAVRLRAMLTWNDPAGAANSDPALVNNLDLTVVNGATTTLPWILDKNNPASNATRAVDNISNIEQVTVNNPPAGSYTLRVAGTAIATGPNQPYALTWIIDQAYMEVLYPNGGESLSPGATETITWDNAGVTLNQTVEYSLNNGGTWNTIAIVGPTITRQTWTVPAANTNQALVRITSGTITDVSDATFTIFGGTPGLTIVPPVGCSAGEVAFTWTAVANATHYDIYSLNPTTGQFVIAAANLTGTSHTITGLTPGANMWFAILAKDNTTGASGPLSNAVNTTVSSGGGGLGAIGSISGQTTICGTPSGVPYNVAAVTGATNYTWTAPPGANIASGQGTNSITINYPAGSANGNVTVFASNSSCSTPTMTLAITIGSATITPPTSGGDQSQTVCPGGPIPTLTATATVPAGHTVVWYNAATGGSTVASPTLSAAGTVTYHAASRNTASGCESITRTAVTLTINQVPAASIAAGGATTFCQPGSVTLTANTGGSYLWSNGATSQAITVSGPLGSTNYTVQVTTGSCVSTSPATTVTVNAVPTATIAAGGPTTFCQGLNVVLTASAGSSWLWSNGATSQAITVTSSGNYTVAVSNGSCSATSAATTVTVNPNPPAVVTAGTATTFCQGGSVTLTANPGTAYLWSNGATSQAITVSGPIGTTNYTVQVTQAGGCVSNSPATAVTVNATPAANITAGGPTAFCQGNNVVLTASAGSSWLWSNGATTQAITVSTTGNYSVTVTGAGGCSASSAATAVAVSASPAVSISAAPYTSLYPGLSTVLTANVTPPGTYTYTWFKNGVLVPGATTPTLTGIDLDDIGSYTVNVINTTGLPCSNTSAALVIKDSVTVKLFIFPSPNAGQFKVSYYTPGTGAVNRLVIYDSKGSQVYNRTYPISSAYQVMSVDMRQHGRGIYRVVLFDKANKRIADGSVVIQ